MRERKEREEKGREKKEKEKKEKEEISTKFEDFHKSMNNSVLLIVEY